MRLIYLIPNMFELEEIVREAESKEVTPRCPIT